MPRNTIVDKKSESNKLKRKRGRQNFSKTIKTETQDNQFDKHSPSTKKQQNKENQTLKSIKKRQMIDSIRRQVNPYYIQSENQVKTIDRNSESKLKQFEMKEQLQKIRSANNNLNKKKNKFNINDLDSYFTEDAKMDYNEEDDQAEYELYGNNTNTLKNISDNDNINSQSNLESVPKSKKDIYNEIILKNKTYKIEKAKLKYMDDKHKKQLDMQLSENTKDLFSANVDESNREIISDEFNKNLMLMRDTQKTKPSRKLQNEIEVDSLMRDILIYAEYLSIKEKGGISKYLKDNYTDEIILNYLDIEKDNLSIEGYKNKIKEYFPEPDKVSGQVLEKSSELLDEAVYPELRFYYDPPQSMTEWNNIVMTLETICKVKYDVDVFKKMLNTVIKRIVTIHNPSISSYNVEKIKNFMRTVLLRVENMEYQI